jgi:APA family basic amino acid/polyamine antiporter
VTAYPWLPLLYLATAAFLVIFIAWGDPRNAGLGLIFIFGGVPLYFYWKKRTGKGGAAAREEATESARKGAA